MNTTSLDVWVICVLVLTHKKNLIVSASASKGCTIFFVFYKCKSAINVKVTVYVCVHTASVCSDSSVKSIMYIYHDTTKFLFHRQF